MTSGRVRTAWSRVGRDTRGVALGFVDQTFSTATNFALSVIAGRVLGPSGLGGVFVGFSVYLVGLGLQRRLLSEPLLSTTASADEDERRRTDGLAMTVSIASSALAVVLVVLAGLLVPGFAGRGILLVAPWLVPTMVQDLVRNLLFRDHRGGAAAVNDGVWAVVMAAAVVPAWLIGTPWAVMGCWGVGALAGAVLGVIQTGARPRGLREAWIWWRGDALPFGKWNAGAALVANIGGNASTFVLSALIGASSLGGLRAAQSVFAPLTLVIPAISLPGLPAVSRAWRAGYERARSIAIRLSILAVAVTAAYAIAMWLGAWRLLPFLFGAKFSRYRELIAPIAVAQLFTAGGVGLLLLMKARRRGRILLLNRALGTSVSLVMVAVLAWRFELIGAAWGAAAGAAVSLAVLSSAALRPPGPHDPPMEGPEADVVVPGDQA